ncbi:hypothetical protein M9Y10_004556 [Tritrichomonas musculus]|uniref:Portal protein n=1 Tax=Tritrichomonas musculus TaxID=1915356 RepID=A0ABR2GPF8_9EUKA
MKIEEFFKIRGYDIKGIIEYKSNNSEYLGWYKGFVENFHKYYIYNGEREVFNNRYTLNMPKKICESFADFLMNERVKITLGDDKSTDILNELLIKSNFWVKANQAVEKTFALGTGCFLLSLDKEKEIKLQFVNADNIYPLTYDNEGITECAFVSDKSVFNKETLQTEVIRDVQTHTLDDLGNYVIRNFRFIVSEGEDLREIPVNDIPAEVQTGSDLRWFVPIKPNVVNNIYLDSPFGLPIYANSLDTIKALDLTYDSFVNEIQNGRKRLFVTQEAMKVGSDGCFKNAFDPTDVLFYILDGNFSDNKSNYVQEVNGELRVTDLNNSIQTNLNLLSTKLGLGEQYFKFENGAIAKTATEVISENSDLFRTIKKHEVILESALIELVHNIAKIGKEANIFAISDENISIDFDDSIIESKEQEIKKDRLDVEMGAMSLTEYRMKWYGEDEKTAKSKIEEINTSNNTHDFSKKEVNK